MHSHRFLTVLVLAMLLTVVGGCDMPGPGQSTPDIQINETGNEPVTEVKTFETNLCGTKGTSSQDYRETYSVSIEGSLGGSVDLAAAKASVTAKYGEGKETSLAKHYDWPPEKNTRLTLTWTWQKWTGDLLVGSETGKFVARLPISVKEHSIDLGCPVMNVSGVWLTPFNDLSYTVTQDQAQVKWLIRESGVNGAGTIEGNTLVSDLGGQKVVYEVGEWDSNRNPTVLYTTNLNYIGVILFRTCADFGKYLADAGGMVAPDLKTRIYDAVRSLPNPQCPDALN